MLDNAQSESYREHNQQERNNDLNGANGYLLKESASQPSPNKRASNGRQKNHAVLDEIDGDHLFHIDGKTGDVNQASDHNAGRDEAFMVKTGPSEEGAPKSSLMPRQSAEKSAEQSSRWKIFLIKRRFGKFWDRFKSREQNHERSNDQFNQRNLERSTHHFVFGQVGKIGKPQEQPRADKRRNDSRNTEALNDIPVGISPDQNQFKQVVGEVDDGRHGDGQIQREERGEGREQKRSQPETGEKCEERSRKSDAADRPEHRVNLPNAFQVSLLSHA